MSSRSPAFAHLILVRPTATPFLKRKSGKVLLILAGLVATVYSFIGWHHLGEVTQTRAIDRELKAALDASHSQPAGIAQFEDLLARITRIDTHRAPDEVKEALANYIKALESDISAFHTHQNLTPYDEDLEKAQKRLAAAVQDHWY